MPAPAKQPKPKVPRRIGRAGTKAWVAHGRRAAPPRFRGHQARGSGR